MEEPSLSRNLFIALIVLTSSLAIAPIASADGGTTGGQECKQLPPELQGPCYNLASGKCNGGVKGYESCLQNLCPQDAQSRVPEGCTEIVCEAPDWNTLTPYGGNDCLEMICRNVPPVFETIKVNALGVAGLLGLGGIPGGEVLVRVLKNAGFYCDPGYGEGGPGSPCQRVVWTPVAAVGADPDAVANIVAGTASECSWAQSGMTGYNYVGTNGIGYAYGNGNCSVWISFYVVMGMDRHYYRFTDSCYP